MKKSSLAVWVCVVLCLSVLRLQANVIGFDERFALADDRESVLKELIPGTEDFYYYSALHYQQQGDLAKAGELIDAAVKKHHRTARMQELEHRQALLTYATDRDRAVATILRHLRPSLNHQQKQLTREVRLPVVLDPSRIDSERLMLAEISREKRNVSGFGPSAYDWLVRQALTPDQRRDLLRRLNRPDYPGFVALVADDLQHEHSGGFGSLPVHGLLMTDQLEALLKVLPDLIKETPFINAYLTKLRPPEGSNWQQDDAATLAYLERLEAFVNRLPPSQNSLKANIAYQRLVFERKQGRFDRERFLTYIRYPRPVHYIHPRYLEQHTSQRHPVDLRANFQAVSLMPPIGVDEPLVREHLLHFLKTEDGSAFADIIESEYLKRCLAETRMVNGIGDQERWFALLRPEEVKQLRDRIDLEFLPTNPAVVAPYEMVSLDVAIKNVETLLVKVYEINASAYYRQHQSELSTAIDLDGLVANHERTETYRLPPMRRHMARFTFPELQSSGVYVVELIGNGVSSRALIQKGSLRYSERLGAAGHILRIFDADGQWLKDATLWAAGREYTANADGEIVVPFAGGMRRQKIILQHRNLATLWNWTQQSETYQLDATVHVEREMLVGGEMCRVLVRPRLTVSGAACDVGLLEDVKLTLSSTDLDGSSAAQEVSGFQLHNDKESIHTFRVPHRMRELTVTLSGTVRNLNSGKPESLAKTVQTLINAIDATEKIENLFLRRTADGYFVELRGRNGEALTDRPIYLTIQNLYLNREITESLKTDEQGRAALGELHDVVWVRARATEESSERWLIDGHFASTHDAYDIAEGETLYLPWTLPAMAAADAVSLLELRGGTPVRDAIEQVSIIEGYLVIKELASGDYRLTYRREGTVKTLAVGQPTGTASGYRQQRLNRPGLQIGNLSDKGKEITFRVLGATPDTRVHVVATRYRHPAATDLLRPLANHRPSVWRANEPESLYLSGRTLGDEFRYVMERKSGRIFPGNMLTRPSLLLNPWRLRDTTTDSEMVAEGEAWLGMAGRRTSGKRSESVHRFGGGVAEGGGFPTLDFLASASVLVDHLVPDRDGMVRLERGILGAGQELHIYAVNNHSGVYHATALAELKEEPRERRLVRYLSPSTHYTQRQEISLVRSGEQFAVDDILSAELEVYDSLDRVYSLFTALNGLPLMGEFSFVLQWPQLDEAVKRERYAKYACHELNIFLYFKDLKFFERVIRPYLANKNDRTFIDDWLLGAADAGYTGAWTHARLNMAERVLLGRALPERRAATARHLRDRYDLLPPDIDGFNARFRTALRSRGLDHSGAVVGLEQAREEVAARERQMAKSLVAPAAFDSVAMVRSPVVMKGMLSSRSVGAAEAEAPMDYLALEEAPASIDMELGHEFAEAVADASEMDGREDLVADSGRRKEVRQLYRKLGQTEEWVENNYYHLPIEQQLAGLVEVNGFWADLAAQGDDLGFMSSHVASASRNFAEMMLALAVLDIPFTAAEHETAFEGGGMTLDAGSDLIVFHKQVRPAEAVAETPTILVAQNFFARNDRYRHENNERFDKFVTRAFEAGRVYGCQVVLTNPTSTRRKIDLLTQIPAGAIAVLGGMQTRTRHLVLDPFSTQTDEYYFYFPFPGTFEHYPVHAAQEGEVIGHSAPFVFDVVAEVTDIDETSWEHISQFASDAQVLYYLARHNVERLDLGLIAFRMRDKAFFKAATDLLRKRFVYNHTLWAYALHHKDTETLREYMPHTPIAAQCGRVIDSPILTLDPVHRHVYQHKEYWPLVNPRVYRLGRERQIFNREFFGQYMSFLENLRYRRTLTNDDLMTLTVYLLLQDRVEEALGFFGRIDRKQVAMQLQYDYMAAYLAFYREMPEEARSIAQAYREHTVKRWRDLFADVLAQADEIAGAGGTAVTDEENRTQTQTRLADSEPRLATQIEGRQIRVEYRNIDSVTLNIYPMDLELLFSRQPFVQDVGEQFAMIRPNESFRYPLEAGEETVLLDIPEDYRDRNVMIEALAAGIRSRTAYYPNSLRVDLVENYGHLKVSVREGGRALPKVYVKVYARMTNGQVRFFKDGYTDLRGRFDYASLNTDDIGQVVRFAILILSEEQGALVREATPPVM